MFLDAIHFKVKQDGAIVNKAAYMVIGIDLDGHKDVLGIWIGENESAKFWLYVSEWQKTARKWIAKAKWMLKRRTWSERIEEQTGKPPSCPKCENHYEYKGEVCLEDGQLRVKYAKCTTSKACLERMIRDVAGVKETKGSKEKEKAAKRTA